MLSYGVVSLGAEIRIVRGIGGKCRNGRMVISIDWNVNYIVSCDITWMAHRLESWTIFICTVGMFSRT